MIRISLALLVLLPLLAAPTTAAEQSIDDDILFAAQLTDFSPLERVIAIMERKLPHEKQWWLKFDLETWDAALDSIDDETDRCLADFAYQLNHYYPRVCFLLQLAVLYRYERDYTKLDTLFIDFEVDTGGAYARKILKEYYNIGIEFYSDIKVDKEKLEWWAWRLVKWEVKDKFKIPASLFISSDRDYHYVSAKTLLGILYFQNNKEKDGSRLIVEGAQEYIRQVVESGTFGISADELLYLAYIYEKQGKEDLAQIARTLCDNMQGEFAIKQAKLALEELESWKAIIEWERKMDAFQEAFPVYGQRLIAIDEYMNSIDEQSVTVYQQIAGRIMGIYDLNKLFLIFLADNHQNNYSEN